LENFVNTKPVKEVPELAAKKKALEVTFSQIDKQYGKGSVMLLGQSTRVSHDSISTGSMLIDNAIGIGGYPRGRIIEIYGPEASGKTTLALHAISQAQRTGGICAFVDAEHALDPAYAAKLGININELIISQPDYGEQALDIVEMLVRSGAIDVLVVDSVAALVPKAEVDGDMGDSHIGLQARLMSQALRKLTPVVHKSKTSLIFINQIRQNLNAMPYANKEVTTGGNALKFYASLRIDIRRIASLKDKEGRQRGNRVAVKIAKNKMAPPFKRVEVELLFGEGISRELDVFNAALAYGVIRQSGAFYYFNGEKIGQGQEQVYALLKGQPEFTERIAGLVKVALEKNVDVQSSLTSGAENEDESIDKVEEAHL
jgi:recombination protein RecA